MHGYRDVLTYNRRATQGGFLLMITVMAAALIAVLASPYIIRGSVLLYSGVSDFGIFSLFIIIKMVRVVNQNTARITAQPISRLSVWLSHITYLLFLSMALAALRTLFNLIGYGLTDILSKSNPSMYTFALEDGWRSFISSKTLTDLWSGIQNIFMVGLLAYFYAELLRRWKRLTLSVSAVICVFSYALFVQPLLHSFVNDINTIAENTRSINAILLIPKWVDVIANITNWINQNLLKMGLISTVIVLPLSFILVQEE
jgi:hypothetical protein